MPMASLPSISSRLRSRRIRSIAAGIAIAAIAVGTVSALNPADPGADYEKSLANQSKPLYGFGQPLGAGATGETDAPGARAVEAAKGLDVSVASDLVGED